MSNNEQPPPGESQPPLAELVHKLPPHLKWLADKYVAQATGENQRVSRFQSAL